MLAVFVIMFLEPLWAIKKAILGKAVIATNSTFL